jgi:hypothetical protein
MGALLLAIQKKIDRGEPLTEAEVREIIRAEAAELGLSLEEAIDRARAGTLPRQFPAPDIELLVGML